MCDPLGYGASMNGRTRLEAYSLLLAVAAVMGFYFGERRVDPPRCDDVGECSLGTEVGLLTAGLVFAVGLLFVGVIEVAVRFLRQRQRTG